LVYYLPADAGGRTTLAITNAKGDTVQTLNGGGAPGLQRVTWNLRMRPAARPPLSPSERRDSVRNELRVTQVADSLIKAGLDSSAVQRVAGQLRGGSGGSAFQRGGGGGGGFGTLQGRGFVDRPGETAAVSQGGGAPGGPDTQRVTQAFRDAGIRGAQGGGGFGGGGAQPGFVEPGEYTVTLKVGDRALTQTLQVIKP
jgi:hypothetical protein